MSVEGFSRKICEDIRVLSLGPQKPRSHSSIWLCFSGSLGENTPSVRVHMRLSLLLSFASFSVRFLVFGKHSDYC